MQRVLMRALATTLSLASSSCSVSGVLSSEEILEELDEIVAVDGGGEALELVYADQAVISNGFMRAVVLQPVRWPLAWAFGRRSMQRLPNSAFHVRELLRELPDETAGGWLSDPDLTTCAAASARFAWVADHDPSAATRIYAMDGLAKISRQLDLHPFAGDFADLLSAQDPGAVADALARAKAAVEQDDDEEVEAAVHAMVAQPLAVIADRIRLVEELASLFVATDGARSRPHVEAALRTAIAHCTRGVLLKSLMGRSRELAEVRLCAMEQVRRLGGARAVPLMLAVMAASPAERANGVPHYDLDTLVQLRLIHYCGQLSPTLAAAVVRLPGRQDWEATSATEFLARTILNERDYYSKLRVPALVALTWCLGRPSVDPDPAWVREWVDNGGS